MSNAVALNAAMTSGGRLLIIDDHPLFREALELAFKSGCGAADVAKADTIAQALGALGDGVFDAILLDLNLPDAEGLDGLLRVRALAGDAPILVISALDDARVVAAVIEAGAAGFVRKNAPREEICQALSRVRAGEVVIPPGHEPQPADADVFERAATLTPQQLRILQELCDGKLNKQIAYDLSIAETTVKAHVTAILRKLNVRSRTQAVLLARGLRFDDILRSAAPSVS